MLILFIVFAVCVLPGTKSEAANFTLALNNSFVDGEIKVAKDVDFYLFTVPSAGTVTITYQGWSIYNSCIQILDQNLATSFASDSIYGASNTNPKTITITLYLEAGSYYAKVYGYSSNIGIYRLKGAFAAANNTETELNNGFNTAMPLGNGSANKVLGFLSATDRVDFYKFQLSSEQRVKITYTSMIYSSNISLWDSDFVQKIKQSNGYPSETNPKITEFSETLPAGVYYLKVEPYNNSYNGRYYLMWDYDYAAVNVTSVSVSGAKNSIQAGSTITYTATVLPTNATNKNVVWSSNNTSVATVNARGLITVIKAGTATITATAADGSGKKGTKTITVTAAPQSISVGTSTTDRTSGYTYKAESVDEEGYMNVALTKIPNKKASSVVIPDTLLINGVTYKVTSVAVNAFKGNKNLKKVTLGKNVRRIGKKGFLWLQKAENAHRPDAGSDYCRQQSL